MLKTNCFLIGVYFTVAFAAAQQINIQRIDQMPEFPEPYEMRDWHQVAVDYDNLVFDTLATGEYMPLVKVYSSGVNYPAHPYFGIQSYVGHQGSGLEAINVLPALIGASLCGIDKSNQNGFDWVLAAQEFFNRANGQMVYLNAPVSSSGNDWWYDLMPNIFFYQLNDLYPHIGDFDAQFIKVADRWLEAVYALGGSTTPWAVPDFNYRAFDLLSGRPLESGVPEPEAAGAMAWIFYNAWTKTQNQKYLQGAEFCLEFLENKESNPSYELMLPYGIYTAARMNAEIGTQYDINKMMNWAFDVGSLRDWGAILGNWNNYDISGLIGEAKNNVRDYAFAMNGFEQMGALLPALKYDERFATALGKWCLNIANASRLFYGKYLPEQNQSNAHWLQNYDPHNCIAYEGLKEIENNLSPVATGDAMAAGWAETNLGLYGSSHVGIFGAIIDTTNVRGILKLDLNATDYYAQNIFPAYLLYNPFAQNHDVMLVHSTEAVKIYDALSNEIIASGNGGINISIPAKKTIVAIVLPQNAELISSNNMTLCNGIVIDYNKGLSTANPAPRIKALASENDSVQMMSEVKIFCSAQENPATGLAYSWTVNGEPYTAGSELLLSFSQIGQKKVVCVISDEDERSDTATLFLEVVEKVAKPPEIELMQAAPPKVKTGEKALLSCHASDPNGDTLTYIWSATEGLLEGNGPDIVYTAPEHEGVYYIKCRVSDEDQMAVADSIALIVYDPNSQPQGDLIAWYKFSGSVYDFSGNGHSGTAYSCDWVADMHGKDEEAVYLPSSAAWIDIPNNEQLNFRNGLSLTMVLSPEALYDREMFVISHGSWEERWKLSLTQSGRLRFTVNSTEGITDVDSETALQIGRYYHIAAVYNAFTLELYVDAKMENFAVCKGMINTSGNDLVMGRNIAGISDYNFRGVLDDVRIFDYGLKYEEVQQYYQEDINSLDEKEYDPARMILSPNPASTEVKIDFPDLMPAGAKLVLYSIDGHMILSQDIDAASQQTALSLVGLSPGMYLLKCISPNKVFAERLVISLIR